MNVVSCILFSLSFHRLCYLQMDGQLSGDNGELCSISEVCIKLEMYIYLYVNLLMSIIILSF